MAIGAAINAFSGIAKAVQGRKAAKAAKIEADKARVEMEKQKKAFAALDTSNPYANMENTMEDLTVNQQQAEFEKQQAMQSQANIMGQMRGAAGSSGIAALAQSLSNQGALQAQRASASIGAQETANQRAAAAEAGRIQDLERQGEMQSRNMQFGKTRSLLGMAAGDVANAQAMEAAGNQQRMAGIGSAIGGVANFAMEGGFGGNKTTAATGVQQADNIPEGMDWSSSAGTGSTGATGGSGMGNINPFQPGTAEYTNWILENE
tara:strand:+ start:1561 stop:2349 length:789 start_codon:yes stop_codon:yes gene_type:complete